MNNFVMILVVVLICRVQIILSYISLTGILRKQISPNFPVQQSRLYALLNEGVNIKSLRKENFVYHFESSNSTNNCQFLVINEIPDAFMDRYSFGSDSLPLRFLVRKCYEDLYEKAKVVMSKNIRKRLAVLFTGVPGIGKSIFLLYFLCRYLSDPTEPDKRFAFESQREIYQYFSPTGIGNEFNCLKNVQEDTYEDESIFPLRDILVVTDFQEKALPGDPRGKRKFLFSSPDPARHKEYLKDKPSYTFYLPTWTKQELLMFNPNVSAWIKWYNIYGGVPRYVFSDEDSSPLLPMKRALEVKGRAIATTFFEPGSYSSIDSDMSYCLVHINPKPVDHDDGPAIQYDDIIYSLASRYVFNKLSQMKDTGFILKAKNLFNSKGSDAPRLYGIATAGIYFAMLCLWIDPIAGKTITVTSLNQENSTLELTLPPSQIIDSKWKRSKEKFSVNVLYQPDFENLESGDAFCAIQKNGRTILIVLQVTVAKDHDVKMNGLQTIIKAYQNVKFDQKIILFVTPADGQLCGVQKIITQKGAEVKRGSEQFEQYVYMHRFNTVKLKKRKRKFFYLSTFKRGRK